VSSRAKKQDGNDRPAGRMPKLAGSFLMNSVGRLGWIAHVSRVQSRR